MFMWVEDLNEQFFTCFVVGTRNTEVGEAGSARVRNFFEELDFSWRQRNSFGAVAAVGQALVKDRVSRLGET
jgi:hypothetical protein